MQTTKATVELTKNDDGMWMNVEFGGKKATVCLSGLKSPLVGQTFTEWADSHFRQTVFGRAVTGGLTFLGECLIAGLVTLVLVALIGGAVWLVYNHAGSMAEGFGAALAAGLLGGAVRYFKTTRRLLHRLTAGKMFK